MKQGRVQKGIGLRPASWEASARKSKSTQADTHLEWVKTQAKHPNPKVVHRGDELPWLERPGLHSWTVSECWLVNKQGVENSLLAAGCHLEVHPNLSGVGIWAPRSWEPRRRLGLAVQRQFRGLGCDPKGAAAASQGPLWAANQGFLLPAAWTLWLYPLHATTWHWIWGRQALEKQSRGAETAHGVE